MLKMGFRLKSLVGATRIHQAHNFYEDVGVGCKVAFSINRQEL
jgi:hypothetical protein